MAALYSIRDWEKHFEKSQSTRVLRASWVAVPNRHDGKSFRRLMRLPDGVAIYGAFHLIIQVASKCPKRGILADEDGPLSPEDISDKTGAPAEIIQKALDVCCEPAIGWVICSERSPSRSGVVSEHAQKDLPTGITGITEHDMTEQDKTEQTPENSSEADSVKVNGSPPVNGCVDLSQAEAIYLAYPRHVGKGKAIPAIVKALRKVPYEELLGAVQEFAKAPAGNAGNFTPYPATWFNGEKWNDDRSEWQRSSDESAKRANHFGTGPGVKYTPDDGSPGPAPMF